MNDPHVVALIYTVQHGNSVSYENASLLSYGDSPEFCLTVDNKTARFELKKHYAEKDEAREVIEQFIQHWEFEAAIRRGPSSFSLRYEGAEIVDRSPSPGTSRSGTIRLRTEGHLLRNIFASAKPTYNVPNYPPPPSGGIVAPDDPDVKSMYDRYVNHRLGKEPLLAMAYFCLTVLECKSKGQRSGKRKVAGQHYHIDEEVLDKIGNLTANKGDLSVARKRGSSIDPLSGQDKKFLKKAVQEMIYRAAEVAADDSQCLPQITMTDLPRL